MLINALRVPPRMVLRAMLDAQILGKHDSEVLLGESEPALYWLRYNHKMSKETGQCSFSALSVIECTLFSLFWNWWENWQTKDEVCLCKIKRCRWVNIMNQLFESFSPALVKICVKKLSWILIFCQISATFPERTWIYFIIVASIMPHVINLSTCPVQVPRQV